MKQEQFENQYKEFWAQFESVLLRLEEKPNNPTDIPSQELETFTSSYRRLCNHLAIAKKRRYSARVIDHLNVLVLKAHSQLYQRKTSFLYRSVRFVLAEFPSCVRRNAKTFWAATAVFYLPGLLMFGAILQYPELIYSVMSPLQLADFETMYNPDLAKLGRERQSDTDLVMFGYYIYNNIGIAFQTFASGLLFTFGTLFYLIFNGVLIGSLSAHIISLEYQVTFFPFIVGHGSFELTAITIAGAAGLKLGLSLLAPGDFTRLESLKNASREAITLIIGAAVMLLFAAFIEAFWSSMTSVPPMVKYLVGGFLWAVVIAYLALAGRRRSLES